MNWLEIIELRSVNRDNGTLEKDLISLMNKIDCEGKPDAIIIATGSEVELAVNAAEQLKIDGIKIRVVSMPSTDVFDNQDDVYKESVLPCECGKRVAVEAGVTDYWRKYIGLDGKALGVDNFGESAPANDVFEHFGLTAEKLEAMIQDLTNT